MKSDINERIRDFVRARDWSQFHSPENLAKSIVIEAAELLENFQWNNEFDIGNVADELADVLIYCYQLVDVLKLDIETILNNKLDKNAIKYPVDKAKGSSKKYTEFES